MDITSIADLMENDGMNFDKIANALSNMSNFVVKYIQSGIINEFTKSIDDSYILLSKYINKLSLNKNKDLQQAYILGYLMALFELESTYKNTEETTNPIDNIDNAYSVELLDEYKDLNEFISLLYQDSVVSHLKLAEVLNLRGSALSNFLDRIKYLEFYSTKKYGRRKFYYITENGRQFYRVICDRYNKNISSNNITEFILRFISLIISESKQRNPSKENLLNQLVKIENCPYITKPHVFNESLDNLIEVLSLKRTNTYIFYKVQRYDSDRYLFELPTKNKTLKLGFSSLMIESIDIDTSERYCDWRELVEV
jgi:hypothetical protein